MFTFLLRSTHCLEYGAHSHPAPEGRCRHLSAQAKAIEVAAAAAARKVEADRKRALKEAKDAEWAAGAPECERKKLLASQRKVEKAEKARLVKEKEDARIAAGGAPKAPHKRKADAAAIPAPRAASPDEEDGGDGVRGPGVEEGAESSGAGTSSKRARKDTFGTDLSNLLAEDL